MKARQDTKLESEGAEFLVLGLLLIEGIAAYKAYINFPGYDLTAVNPETKRVARIQVKSRLREVRKEGGWNKVQIGKLTDVEYYVDNWKLIKDYLHEVF